MTERFMTDLRCRNHTPVGETGLRGMGVGSLSAEKELNDITVRDLVVPPDGAHMAEVLDLVQTAELDQFRS